MLRMFKTGCEYSKHVSNVSNALRIQKRIANIQNNTFQMFQTVANIQNDTF